MRIYYTRVTIAIDSNYRQVFASEEIRIYLHQIDSSIKSDVCDRYLTRAKRTAEDQYSSLRSAISETIQCQGWKVEQIAFITGARSVNKQDLSKNLKFFNVTEASMAMRVFDVYANIFKCMYSTRFSGGSTRSEASPEAQPTPIVDKIIGYRVYRTT